MEYRIEWCGRQINSPPNSHTVILWTREYDRLHSNMKFTLWMKLRLLIKIRRFSWFIQCNHNSSDMTEKVLIILFVYCAHLWLKFSFDISNFLEEVSNFLILLLSSIFKPCSLMRPSCLSLLISGTSYLVGCTFHFLHCFSLLFFLLLFVKPPWTTILPLFISFSLGWFFLASCIILQTSVHCSLGSLFNRANCLSLFITSTV